MHCRRLLLGFHFPKRCKRIPTALREKFRVGCRAPVILPLRKIGSLFRIAEPAVARVVNHLAFQSSEAASPAISGTKPQPDREALPSTTVYMLTSLVQVPATPCSIQIVKAEE